MSNDHLTFVWAGMSKADRFGVTRNVVAGILFRHRHPLSERIRSPNGASPNKVGHGYRRGDYAYYTAWNSRP